MDFFTLLFSDPIVAASIAVITATFVIISYLAFFFVRHTINDEPTDEENS